MHCRSGICAILVCIPCLLVVFDGYSLVLCCYVHIKCIKECCG